MPICFSRKNENPTVKTQVQGWGSRELGAGPPTTGSGLSSSTVDGGRGSAGDPRPGRHAANTYATARGGGRRGGTLMGGPWGARFVEGDDPDGFGAWGAGRGRGDGDGSRGGQWQTPRYPAGESEVGRDDQAQAAAEAAMAMVGYSRSWEGAAAAAAVEGVGVGGRRGRGGRGGGSGDGSEDFPTPGYGR